MSEWVEKRLGDFCSFKYGKMPQADILTDDDSAFPVFSGYRITGFCSEYNIDSGELIVVARGVGGTGDVKLTPAKCYLTNLSIAVLVDNKLALKQYLYYYFFKSGLRYLDSGSAQSQVTITDLQRVKILLPPLPTQTRIASILSAYDDAIENYNRRIGLLEKAARELYREWFVRFRFPGHEGVKIVNGLPEGWEVTPLGDTVNITSSKRIYLSDYVDEGIPFYRSKEVIQSTNGEALTESLYISVDKYNELKNKFGAPCENDILLTSVGTIGVSFLVDNRVFYFKDGNLTWLQSGVKPKLALYIYLWLNSDIGQGELVSSTIGTSQSALTIENLKRIKYVKPNDDVLSVFYDKAMSFVKLKRNLLQQSQNLARQRDLLLPRLMSGKLEV